MKVAPLNKTAIVEYSDVELKLKLRNINQNTRKRVKIALKHKIIKLETYNEKALVLNGWVSIRHPDIELLAKNTNEKGILNCKAYTQEEIDKIKELNGEIRCSLGSEIQLRPTEFEFVGSLYVSKGNYKTMSAQSFKRIQYLFFDAVNEEIITNLLKRVEFVDYLEVSNCELLKLDLSRVKTKGINLLGVKTKTRIKLPPFLNLLRLIHLEKFDIVDSQKINELSLHSSEAFSEEDTNWVKSLESLKSLEFVFKGIENIECSPSSLRKIKGNIRFTAKNLEGIKKKFPYLIAIQGHVEGVLFEELKLREVSGSLFEYFYRKFTTKPRKVCVNNHNVVLINNRPELLEAVQEIQLENSIMDLDNLPGEIKKVTIFPSFNLEPKVKEAFKRNAWKFNKADLTIHYSNITEALYPITTTQSTGLIRVDYEMVERVRKRFPNMRIKSI